MRESLMYGSVRGARGNSRPYRDVANAQSFAAVHSQVLALRSYAENDAQRPLLEVKADSHVAVR